MSFAPPSGLLPTPPPSVSSAELPVASTSASSNGMVALSERILDVLYSGFNEGSYHDVVLHTPERPYRLHRLLLSQSPRLRPLLAAGGDVRVAFAAPGMTEEGFAICLQAFYSSRSAAYLVKDADASRTRASVELFVGVLSSAVWLGGLDELADITFEKCLESICAGTILQWIALLSTPQADPPPLGPAYHARLSARVRRVLSAELPAATGAFAPAPNASGLAELEELFAALPWAWLKETVESPAFPAAERSRFSFAKAVVQRRKARPEVRASGTDEAVVLAFGGDGGSVCLTRKARRPRGLFKVSS